MVGAEGERAAVPSAHAPKKEGLAESQPYGRSLARPSTPGEGFYLEWITMLPPEIDVVGVAVSLVFISLS